MKKRAKKSAEERILRTIFGKLPERQKKKLLDPEKVKELREKIEAVLDTFTYREREIIKLRYGLSDGYSYTPEEIGRIFKETRERVCQIEAEAIRKLQHPVCARLIKSYLEPTPKDP